MPQQMLEASCAKFILYLLFRPQSRADIYKETDTRHRLFSFLDISTLVFSYRNDAFLCHFSTALHLVQF